MVGILFAHRQNARQTRLAQNRLIAIAALDELLHAHFNLGDGAVDNAQLDFHLGTGKVPGDNNFHWRAIERYDAATDSIGASILRLELFDPAFDGGESLASVELLSATNKQMGRYDGPN